MTELERKIKKLEAIGVLVLFDDEDDEFYWVDVNKETDYLFQGFETEEQAVEDALKAYGLDKPSFRGYVHFMRTMVEKAAGMNHSVKIPATFPVPKDWDIRDNDR